MRRFLLQQPQQTAEVAAEARRKHRQSSRFCAATEASLYHAHFNNLPLENLSPDEQLDTACEEKTCAKKFSSRGVRCLDLDYNFDFVHLQTSIFCLITTTNLKLPMRVNVSVMNFFLVASVLLREQLFNL